MSVPIVGIARQGLTALAIVATLSTEAAAQDRNICLARDDARSIEACGRVIAAGQLVGKDLATIYVVRATLFRADGSYDRAIEDMTQAIELLKATASNSIVAAAYVTRGSFYSLSGTPAKALADYQQALALDANNAQAQEAVKTLQSQLASTIADSPSTQTPPQFAVPNEPLPSNIPVSSNIMTLVQTHPFFASPPPVRVGAYTTASSYRITMNTPGGATTIKNSEDAFVKWIRGGIVDADRNTQSESGNMAGSADSTDHTESVLASDGFIILGSRSVGESKLGESVTTLQTFKIEDLSGRIFPMRLGNQFSFKLTIHTNTVIAGRRYHTETINSNHCSVARVFDADVFHPDLTGSAYLVQCDTQSNTDGNSFAGRNENIFFENLGYWINVDPVLLKQQVVSNGEIGTVVIGKTGQRVTSRTIGTHTLISFSMSR